MRAHSASLADVSMFEAIEVNDDSESLFLAETHPQLI
jgi:hypothetical protein